MGNELSRLFDEVLIVPLDSEFTSSLIDLYDDVLNDDEFSIDECIIFFIRGRGSSIKSILQQAYETKYGDELRLPEVCYQLYAQYMAYWYICHDEAKADDSRLDAAMTVRCMMTLYRGCKGQMPSSLYVEDMLNYVTQISHTSYCSLDNQPRLDILGQHLFTQEQKNDINLFLMVKALAVKAARYDFGNLRNKLVAINEDNPYLKAYEIAARLAGVAHWEYVMAKPELTIDDLLGKYKSNKMLATIRHELQEEKGYTTMVPKRESSVILSYLYGGSYADSLERQKFTPSQFAQYLFYEFISERR